MLMLAAGAAWEIGEILVVNGNTKTEWRVVRHDITDSGIQSSSSVVSKDQEGKQWEWDLGIASNEQLEDYKQNGGRETAAAPDAEEPAVPQVCLKGPQLEPYLGRKMLMLAEAKYWQAGETLVVRGNSSRNWLLVRHVMTASGARCMKLSVSKNAEGKQWDWDFGFSVDGRGTGEDASAPVDKGDSLKGKWRDEEQERSEPGPAQVGRQIRMLQKKKLWGEGEVFTVVGVNNTGALRIQGVGHPGPLTVQRSLEHTQWVFVEGSEQQAEEPDTAGDVDAKPRQRPPPPDPGARAEAGGGAAADPYVGREIKMLTAGANWTAGQVFQVTGSSRSSLQILRATAKGKVPTYVARAAEGAQWELLESPLRDGRGKGAGAGAGASAPPGAVGVRLQGPELEPYLGRKIRVLAANKHWEAGELMAVSGNNKNQWLISRAERDSEDKLFVDKKFEGKQWEWYREPYVGRQIRMLTNKAKWNAGHEFTVVEATERTLKFNRETPKGTSAAMYVEREDEGSHWELVEEPEETREDPEMQEGEAEEAGIAADADMAAEAEAKAGQSKKRKRRDDEEVEENPEDLQHIGREVRILKKAKLWQPGDIFTVQGSKGSSWIIQQGLTVEKDGCGKQWEWVE